MIMKKNKKKGKSKTPKKSGSNAKTSGDFILEVGNSWSLLKDISTVSFNHRLHCVLNLIS